jgi:urease subunit alpha
MLRNDRTADVRVEASTGRVSLDGTPLSSPPADATPLSRLYFL